MLGYSIGGRVCLKIIELMPENIDKTVLLAPDGLTFNTLYYFVTRNFIGKKLFRSFLQEPSKYMHWVERAKKNKWIDESRYKFAMRYLQSPTSREFLWKVWPCMAHIIPDINKVKKAISKYALPVEIFMGKHDRIIPVSQARSFQKELDSVQLHILDRGHHMFDAETVPQISSALA